MLLSSTKQQVGKKNEYQYLNPQWYKEFTWLHVCNAHKVFCYYCLLAHNKDLTTSLWNSFFAEGSRKWKKAVEHFHTHEVVDLYLNRICDKFIRYICMHTAIKGEGSLSVCTPLTTYRYYDQIPFPKHLPTLVNKATALWSAACLDPLQCFV